MQGRGVEMRRGISIMALVALASACDGGTPAMDASAPTVVIRGGAADGPSGFTPLAGVEVCVLDRPEVACDTTGADGRFELTGVPGGADHQLTLRDDDTGYFPLLAHVAAGSEDVELGTFGLVLDDVADTIAGAAGLTIDRSRALVVFEAFDSFATAIGGRPDTPQPDVTFALDPADATELVYFDDDGAPDPALTATSRRGIGFFFGVPAGEHTLSFDHATSTCERAPFAWAGPGGETVRLRAVAGYFVNAGYAVCQPF